MTSYCRRVQLTLRQEVSFSDVFSRADIIVHKPFKQILTRHAKNCQQASTFSPRIFFPHPPFHLMMT